MIAVVIAGLVLVLLVSLGRGRLRGRMGWQLVAWGLTLGSLAAGVWVTLRGGWMDGLLLFGAAAYMAAMTGPPARRRARMAPFPPPLDMAVAEAMATLGVGPEAGREEIEAAYRRLMLRVHPDHGGAPGLAAQLNVARDVLLRR